MNLSDEKRKALVKDLDVLCERYNLGFDDFLHELSREMHQQALKCDHPAVQSCLESVSDGLAHASLDFYVSTK